jgi:hypothetical protein
MQKQQPQKIQVLIDLLSLIDSDEDIDTNDTRYVHPLIEAVIFLANECLTIDNSRPNFQALQLAGYKTYPAEQDSFGWLTGYIQLQKRDNQQILFG